MSFSVSVNDALRKAMADPDVVAASQPGDVVLQELVETLKDQAVRREVFTFAADLQVTGVDLDITHVHAVIDALILVLEGSDG